MSRLPLRKLQIAVAAKNQQSLDNFRSGLKAARLLGNEDVEICIASNGPDVVTDLDVISVLSMPKETSIFQLWAAAVQKGNAQYVALMDADCPPAAGWWDRACSAIDSGTPIFYGSVIPGWPEGDRALTGYIIEYAQFNEPLNAPANEYPGNNIVFRRSLLSADDFPIDGFRKTFFVNRLLNEGEPPPCPIEQMPVSYLKPFDAASYMRRRYMHGRAFGAQNGAGKGAIRIWYTVRCLALPTLRMLRIFRAVRPDKTLMRSARGIIWDIARSEVAWSLGEGAGYLFGPVNSTQGLD